MDRKALLEQIRNKVKSGSGASDPTQFRVRKLKGGDKLKYKLIILPGLLKGDKCASGVASATMDEMEFQDGDKTVKEAYFCVKGGYHWVNKRSHPCPRLYDNDNCPMCEMGFALLNETDVEEERQKIRRLYLPSSTYTANVYFPKLKANPEDLRGKVMWYQMPKTVYDKLEACLLAEDAGDDADDPRPFGDFYNPNDCYVFLLEVKSKSGYNNYEDSKFIVKRVALAKEDEEIQAILNQRYDIMAKIPARNTKEMEDIMLRLTNAPQPQKKAAPTPTADDDDDEMPAPRKKAAPVEEAEERPAPKPEKESKESAAADIDDPELQELINQVKKDGI